MRSAILILKALTIFNFVLDVMINSKSLLWTGNILSGIGIFSEGEVFGDAMLYIIVSMCYFASNGCFFYKHIPEDNRIYLSEKVLLFRRGA